MITYNNIVNRFEKFVEDHLLLKTFTHGSPSGVDLEKFEVYPALHLVYTGATYESTSKEYSFEVYILDLPPDKAKKIENQTQLVSNAEQVAEDILADMMNGDHVFDFNDLYTVTNASTTPLEETTSNSLAGILLTISIEVGYAFDSCNAPLSGVTPSGSGFPVASASGLRIVEIDGSPDVSNVTKIIVSNGTLVDNGSGIVTLETGGGDVVSVNGEIGVVVLDTDDISEGGSNEYYTDARVEANPAVVLNTDKTGITSGQASEITANTAKVGITSTQATEIADNTLKVGITSGQASEISANTLKVGITTQQSSDITANNAKVGITTQQASDITTNNAKVGITPTQASEIDANTLKVGITPTQASDITTNNAKVGITSGQASEITANTLKVGITPTQASDIVTNNAKVGYTDTAVDARIALADLEDLNDVVITSVATGEVIKWNGSNWVNGTGGGGGGAVDSVNGEIGVVVLDTDDINEGTTNLYYTEARVDANPDVVANTAKVGITPTQSANITANVNGIADNIVDIAQNALDISNKVSNVQSDWNATTGLAVILNKPTAATGVSSIIAGTNVTISPVGGTGAVTVNASGGGGGGLTEYPLANVSGRFQWSSNDDGEAVHIGQTSYGPFNYYAFSTEPTAQTLKNYDATDVIDVSTSTISDYHPQSFGVYVPNSGMKVKAKIVFRVNNGNTLDFGFSLWSCPNPANGQQTTNTVTLRARSAAITADFYNTKLWNLELTTTSAISNEYIFLLAEQRAGNLTTTVYAYSNISFMLV